ncbi:beta-eliminating lyase-related protein [Garicola koreensis]|uniref:Threonine aldolase n=1 Tax=Garicola koreensis TaxID=1262554 RepID=A0A7W5XNP1_9MICC|nr:threonine aldolase [Garicola koreensis]
MGSQRARGSAELDPTFASDNTAGVSAEVLEALSDANADSALPYGADASSEQLTQWAKAEFGAQAQILPVFNGTGGNVVALQALLPRWGGVICAQQAHVNNDEGAAPERVGAMKLLPRHTADGKLTGEDILAETSAVGFVHAAQPLAVSLTQSTELGSLYTLEETAALAETAHAHGMGVHVDGARIANAAAALGVSLGEASADVGVDVLSLGGTKNGAMSAEAVVVINPERSRGADYIRKFSMQLASKQRFISAQLLRLFGSELWRDNAKHANAQAASLGEQLAQIPGVRLAGSPAVNAVFPEVPQDVAARIQSRYLAHVWDTAPTGNPVLRLMCSWQTTDEQIRQLVATAAGE